ncbi:MAG: transglutaminase-like domain-containing protein, partial [Nanoarchaeota archaeon]|nr:transglutaminase-like domain-containing protein [Nanoarchaeota archaeon]
MKKIISFFAIILLLSALAYAQDEWYYNSQSLVIDINVSSSAEIQPKSSDYSVKYITVNLSHYPYTDFGQKVLSIKAYPEPVVESNAMLFRWENPRDKISFGYDARLKTSNNIVGVKEKIPFPIKNIPDDIKQFTKPSEIINSDDEDIIGFASEIAQGEDDLYVVVHKIAEWTKSNVKYNLSTLTAEVSQKASWVLDNRQGVCDELTSLFIAMLRSLGIPGKFVSGVAYTNDPSFAENWGSHGWAEVYFPGYGWIPYDVTYGEFGYIDPTHVKLKESLDTSEPSVKYAWVAHNVNDLKTKKLEISTSLADKIGMVKNPISIDANALKDNVGFGSYNLIEAVLKNPEDYYISSEVFLSMPKEVEVIGDNFKQVLLKPNEKKSIFWIVKLTGNLESNFIYTFPISISVVRGAEKNA